MSTAGTAPTPGALMRSEIAEQPARWRDLLASQGPALAEAARLVSTRRPSSIVFAARGSSDHAALYAQYLAQLSLGLPASFAAPSIDAAAARATYSPSTLVVGVSQSGSSPDLLTTLEVARAAGARTLAFTNADDSPMAQAADVHVSLSAGPEQSVAATKTYTAELLALHAWLSLAAGENGGSLRSRVDRLADLARVMLRRSADPVASLARELVDRDRAMVVGRGYSYATAREGALKLMETCSIAASGWSAADAKHGPIAQIIEGTPVLLLAGAEYGRDSVLALAADVLGRGGVPYVVGPGPVGVDVRQVVSMPDVRDAEMPMLEILPLQQLALELSLARGLDPDRPDGLTKVTSTV